MHQTDTGAVLSAHPSSRSWGDCTRKRAGGLAAMIRRILDGVTRRRGRRREVLARHSLERLPDRILRDIGIEPDSRQRMDPRLHSPPF